MARNSLPPPPPPYRLRTRIDQRAARVRRGRVALAAAVPVISMALIAWMAPAPLGPLAATVLGLAGAFLLFTAVSAALPPED